MVALSHPVSFKLNILFNAYVESIFVQERSGRMSNDARNSPSLMGANHCN